MGSYLYPKLVHHFYTYFQGATMGASQCGLAIYIKRYLKAKEELWKLKYFTNAKIYLTFKKKSSKRNQNPSRYYNPKTPPPFGPLSIFTPIHYVYIVLIILPSPPKIKVI
jgi:hypothetical protein